MGGKGDPPPLPRSPPTRQPLYISHTQITNARGPNVMLYSRARFVDPPRMARCGCSAFPLVLTAATTTDKYKPPALAAMRKIQRQTFSTALLLVIANRASLSVSASASPVLFLKMLPGPLCPVLSPHLLIAISLYAIPAPVYR